VIDEVMIFDAAIFAACPADFDGDGTVGASGILTLLDNWGACP